MSGTFILTAFLLTLLSGLPGLFMKKGSPFAQIGASLLHLTGCIFGIISLVIVFAGGSFADTYVWSYAGEQLGINLDPVAAFFLLPVLVVMAAGTIYGHGYWAEKSHPDNGRKLRFYYGALTGGLILVLVAADAWSFLAGWEIVGLSAFFLVLTESQKEETVRAGWIYLIATHASVLLLFGLFSFVRVETGTWLFTGITALNGSLIAILLLALAGFGIKAGLIPFHVWLPEAHAAAPGHISAILSGVVLKIGVYGVVRFVDLLPDVPSWFGILMLFAGIVSGLLGVIFAIAQHDLKRLLAYHSIENIGIIFMGLGAAVLGKNEVWGAFALAGALLHVWNHAFFKALLFFAAGSVIHATGVRSIDALGGLMRKMQATGFAFLIGAVAISGLPPLNGFVSEWLIYVASFKSIHGPANTAILAVPALALIGGLAVACFVKAFSVVFLGLPRSAAAGAATGHEPLSMQIAMGLLVFLCFAIGFWPLIAHLPLLQTVRLVLNTTAGSLEIHSHFAILPAATMTALALILFLGAILFFLSRKKSSALTWDCGYAAPNKRMQYTASSFAAPQVNLFRWALHPDVHKPPEMALFPAESKFESHVPDPVLNRLLVPWIFRTQKILERARVIQSGHIQVYIVYVVATLLVLLIWSLQ